ncbi:hypothetical protein [Streptomyces sp. NPDC002845]
MRRYRARLLVPAAIAALALTAGSAAAHTSPVPAAAERAGCRAGSREAAKKSVKVNAALAEPWRELWDNDLSLTDKIIAPGLVVHTAPIGGSGSGEHRGRDGPNQWVAGIHTLFSKPDPVIPCADVRHPRGLR